MNKSKYLIDEERDNKKREYMREYRKKYLTNEERDSKRKEYQKEYHKKRNENKPYPAYKYNALMKKCNKAMKINERMLNSINYLRSEAKKHNDLVKIKIEEELRNDK